MPYSVDFFKRITIIYDAETFLLQIAERPK